MMEDWKNTIWRQLGASMDMLENSIAECPEEIWYDGGRDFSSYWYIASHTVFWLDYYLSGGGKDFAPPSPFGLEELDPAGVIPESIYSKRQMLDYLQYCREKCRNVIKQYPQKEITYEFPWGAASTGELLLYNLRHVQHHAAQLYLILRQKNHDPPRWAGAAKIGL